MEVKHTPLPWKAENGESRGAWIMGADEGWAALVCGDNDSTAIANKDFIVRACNSHYELLEALRQCASEIGEWSRPKSSNGMTSVSVDHPLMRAQAKAYEAIAKAEGRA